MYYPSSPAWSIPGRPSSAPVRSYPGPGQYSPNISKFRNSPNCRIGSSKRSEFRSAFAPGPGSYTPNQSKFENSPSFSYGKSLRDGTKKDLTPGPGTYNSSQIFMTVGGQIGKSDRSLILGQNATPGPGSYNLPSQVAAGPRYSIASRRPASSGQLLPGPGAYDINFNKTTSKENSPLYRIGSASRSTRLENSSPGPGNYKIQSTVSGPKWVFGSSARTNSKPSGMPGPGSYNSLNMLSNQGYSIQGRYSPLKSFNTPGPGTYTNLNLAKTCSWSMGRSVRNDINGKTSAPGPGAYDNRSSLNKTATVFGRANRTGIIGTSFVPGPGQYNVSTFKKYGGYTFGIRSQSVPKSFVPGPGQYNQTQGSLFYLKQSNGNGWTFPKDRRGQDMKGFGPGPGAYSICSSIGNIPLYARR